MAEPLKRLDICPAEDDAIRILVAGDFCLRASLTEGRHKASPQGLYSQELLSVLHAADISIVNHECPFADGRRRILATGPHLAASRETVDMLKQARFDVVALANNHMMDYGAEAMFDTQATFENAGLKAVGVGRDREDAARPLIVEVKRVKLGICAFVEDEFSCATEESPGTARLDPITVARTIEKARASSDIVLVYAHGGNEYYPIPSPRINTWYRYFVECGADAVIGTHPHTIQGTEVYRGKPIVYSLGNFVFPTPVKRPECWDYGAIVRLTMSAGRLCRVESWMSQQVCSPAGLSVRLVDGAIEGKLVDWATRIDAIATDPALIREHWKWFCRERTPSYLASLKLISARTEVNMLELAKAALRRRRMEYVAFNMWGEVANRFVSRRGRRADIEHLRARFACPAHQDVLATIFEMERLDATPKREVEAEFRTVIRPCR